MKIIEENKIFEMPLSVDRNSREFDLALLKELKLLTDIPVNKFDAIIKRIMKKKTSTKLWISDKTIEEWNGKEYQEVNYRCRPMSHRARYFFCLKLNKNETSVTVVDGFLRAV